MCCRNCDGRGLDANVPCVAGTVKAVDVMLEPATTATPDGKGLAVAHGKKIRSVDVIGSINLHGEDARSVSQRDLPKFSGTLHQYARKAEYTIIVTISTLTNYSHNQHCYYYSNTIILIFKYSFKY